MGAGHRGPPPQGIRRRRERRPLPGRQCERASLGAVDDAGGVYVCIHGLGQAPCQILGTEMAGSLSALLNCWVPKPGPVRSGRSTQLLPLLVSQTLAARSGSFPQGFLSKTPKPERKGLEIQSPEILKEMTNHRKVLQLKSPPAHRPASLLHSGST